MTEDNAILQQAENILVRRAARFRAGTSRPHAADAADLCAIAADAADRYAIAADALQRVLGIQAPSITDADGRRLGARVVAAVVDEALVGPLRAAIARAFPAPPPPSIGCLLAQLADGDEASPGDDATRAPEVARLAARLDAAESKLAEADRRDDERRLTLLAALGGAGQEDWSAVSARVRCLLDERDNLRRRLEMAEAQRDGEPYVVAEGYRHLLARRVGLASGTPWRLVAPAVLDAIERRSASDAVHVVNAVLALPEATWAKLLDARRHKASAREASEALDLHTAAAVDAVNVVAAALAPHGETP